MSDKQFKQLRLTLLAILFETIHDDASIKYLADSLKRAGATYEEVEKFLPTPIQKG